MALTLGLAAGLLHGARAATPLFTPGNLAVLQLGDGGTNRCLPLGANTGITNYAASDLFGSRQNQLFIDQFDPNGVNQRTPAIQVAIPTNGPGAMLINGNAGTEGNLTLAGDGSRLAFTAYKGDILSITTGGQTAPSNLNYDRGIGTVDAFGNYANVYRGGGWYGVATGKTNPRGVATDGAGNFWGCGNGYGSLYFNPDATPDGPIQFQNIALTSCSKVINHRLLATVKNSESVSLFPAGVYSFVDFYNNPVAYPSAASYLHLEIPADPAHNNCIGFDVNPQGTVAYLCDASANSSGGIQKYIRSGLSWKMAYHLTIPGYFGLNTGTMTNAGSTSVLVGCFSVAVDWSGPYPVVYATTGDSGVNSGNPYYGNRVIRIDDTNAITSGATITATTNILKTVAFPPIVGGVQVTNLVYKSVVFTPDLRPVITNNPVNWSAVVGDNVAFTVGATSPYAMTYQWLAAGTNLPGETAVTLSLTGVPLSADGTAFQCVVGNDYGAITSSIATLTVSSTATPPVFGPLQNLTNYVGNNQDIAVTFTSGTDPKGGYQWYRNGTALSDGPGGNGSTLSGTTGARLSITQASTNDAGVYSLTVTNVAGSASNAVAVLYELYASPILVQPPLASTTFLGRNATNLVSAYGQLLSYQWYTSTNKTSAIATGLTPLSESGHFAGTATATLGVIGALATDATNYVVVVSNPGGAVTSAPVALAVVPAPAHTFVAYNSPGQLYAQNFNSLPIPGLSSAEGANPLHMANVMTNLSGMLTNGNPGVLNNLAADVTYSTDSPLDFGYPVLASGGIGGLGLSNSLGGWYGWAQKALVFAAGKGDQSQGAVVDNGGNYYADGTPLTGITNRALGLLATTKTGPVAFGAGFLNRTTNTLTLLNLAYTGELWRNNPSQQVLRFGYVVDPAGTNAVFRPDLWDATNGINYVTSLDVAFATSASTTINDGTLSSNQMSLAISSLAISNWPPGTVLWLMWQGQTLGSAQDVAIDDLSLVAGMVAAPSTTTQPATTITPVTATLNGLVNPNSRPTTWYFEYGLTASYGQVTATNNLAAGISAAPVAAPITGLAPGTTYHFRAVAANDLGTSPGSDLTLTTSPIASPRLGGANYAADGMHFSFTSTAGVSFTVLGTTNLALPINQWENLGQPVEGPAGQYQFHDPQSPSKAQRFYILRQP